MCCPQCDKDLGEPAGNACPSCGASLVIIAANRGIWPQLLLWFGVGCLVVYLVGQSLWFFFEYNTFMLIVRSGTGLADPAALADSIRIGLILSWFSRSLLGVGLICIAVALVVTLRRLR